MTTRLGVDVGGTFTDLVFYDEETGQVRVAKGSTTPAAPDEGVAQVVGSGVPRGGIGSSAFFLHGTTVGLNALLERKGAVVGLLTTRGFRDVLEMRRGDRDLMYDMLWHPPEPLVPRRLRLPVTERITSRGAVETPLQEDDVEAALGVFRENDVQSIAIVFINAHANPQHEVAAAQILRRLGFEGSISLSHHVSGEYREFERSSTTVLDAYVRPRVSGYLQRLQATLERDGFSGECLITRSGGGAMTFLEANDRPFETIMSGPVAGAVGTGELCRDLGISHAITADVGGTSFDTCLVVDGWPQVKYEGRVAGMPIQTPWVDVRSIGAGGGSIAYRDEGGLLRVGPQSAGADPGPVCYGRGGSRPTVTDAAGELGMLAFGELAGGVTLDITSAREAIQALGSELSLSVDETARGILTIANAAMANAIRSVTVEQGQDPRTATLVAFGGAGPLFGCLLARELDISEIIVPNYAGNFSAWGLLGQDVTRSAALTSINALDDEGLAAAADIHANLLEQLRQRKGASAALETAEEITEAAFDLRYTGQEYTLSVPIPVGSNGRPEAEPATIAERFARDYERAFGHTLDEPVEIVAVRATTRLPLPRRSTSFAAATPRQEPRETRTIDAFSFALERRTEFLVADRRDLIPGDHLRGPAILLEPTTTTYVDHGFDVTVHPTGHLFIRDSVEGGQS